MIKSIKELKMEKEGLITPRQAVELISDEVTSGRVESLVAVLSDGEGYLNVTWSNEESVKVLGMLEYAKAVVLETMAEEGEYK